MREVWGERRKGQWRMGWRRMGCRKKVKEYMFGKLEREGEERMLSQHSKLIIFSTFLIIKRGVARLIAILLQKYI